MINIRHQLILIFLFVVGMFLVFGVYTSSVYNHAMVRSDEILGATRDELMMAYQIKVTFRSQQLAWANLMLRGQEPDKYYRYLSRFYDLEREARQIINALLSVAGKDVLLHDGPGRSHVNVARQFLEDYYVLGRQYRQALSIYNASDDPTFETDRYIWEAAENPSSQIDRMIDEIVEHHHGQVMLMTDRVNTELSRLWLGAALLLFLSMAGLAWFAYYRIGWPLNIMTTVAQHIRDGDTNRRVPILSGVEFRTLGETLNSMLNRLDKVNHSMADKVEELEEEIDGRREIELTLAEKTKELQETNDELEAFSYTIAHDLRAPLRAITGFSQLLQDDLKGKIDPEHQSSLDRVSAAGLRMAEQIDHILNLARISRAELSLVQVDLSHLAEGVVQEIRDGDPGRQVEIDIQPGLHVMADASLLLIVLENLLGNAWKYTRNQENPVIRFSACEENGKTVYRVADNGVGFNMDYAHKLFKAFDRLHTVDEFEGIGIGLASVQRAIRRHGGWIRGKGELHKGAEFVFSLA